MKKSKEKGDVEMGSVGSNEKIFTCPYCDTKIRRVEKSGNIVLKCPACKKEFNSKVHGEIIKQEEYGPNKIICTWILFVVNVLTYVCNMDSDSSITNGGANYTHIVEYGEYYRKFTSMFLHLGIIHIIMNMLALLAYGYEIESKLGSLKMIIIYFASGIGSALFSIHIHYLIEPDILTNSVGASGAIFGLLVAAVFINAKEQGDGLIKALGTSIIGAIVYAVITWSIGVDLYGHIGGAVAGGITTGLLTIGYTRPQKQKRIVTSLAVIITLCLTLFVISSIPDNEIVENSNISFVKNGYPSNMPHTCSHADLLYCFIRVFLNWHNHVCFYSCLTVVFT